MRLALRVLFRLGAWTGLENRLFAVSRRRDDA